MLAVEERYGLHSGIPNLKAPCRTFIRLRQCRGRIRRRVRARGSLRPPKDFNKTVTETGLSRQATSKFTEALSTAGRTSGGEKGHND